MLGRPPVSVRKLLLVEDNPGDADLVQEYLLDAGQQAPSIDVVQSLEEAFRRLQSDSYDAVLLDLELPDSSGLETLERALDRAPHIPIIVLTAGGRAELGIQALSRGAADFLPKSELDGNLLIRSVRYARERHRRHEVEAKYRALVENSRDLVGIVSPDLTIRYLSPSVNAVLGYEPEIRVGTDARLELHPQDESDVRQELQRLAEVPGATCSFQCRVRHRDGSWRVLDTIAQNLLADPHIRGFVTNSRDVTELRKAEEIASRNAQRLERTLEALEDAVFTVETPSRTIVDCNPAAERMFGRSADSMIGQSTAILHVDEAAHARVGAESRAALQESGSLRTELRGRRGDGTEFPVEITITLLQPEQGPDGGIVTVVRDITERVEKARQAVFQAALLRQVGQPVIAVDEEARVTYWNEAAEALTGFTATEVMGRELLNLMIPPDQLEIAMLARSSARSGGRWHGEIRLRKKNDGEAVVLATVTPAVNPDGSSGGRIAAGVDVTELREAEEQSRRAAERLRFQAEMLQAVGQAVIATDNEGRITYWNRAAEDLYGWSREEALGRGVLEITPSQDNVDLSSEIFGALQAGKAWTGEIGLRRRDGSTFQGLVTTSPVLDEDGSIVGAIGISSDLTSRQQMEERLRQAEKMEAVGRLAGGIAHDFNNLLTAVAGHATMLREDIPPDSPLLDPVEQILKAGDRAAALTRQLLAFSRKQVLEPRSLDLNLAIAELQGLLRPLVPENIAFTVVPARGQVVVRTDPGQLHQVVINLAVNALDAMEHGGSITIAIDSVELTGEEAMAIPWNANPGHYGRLSIADTGIGMTSEVQSHIFEPFFTTKPEGRGTGLGLATVYGIVKQSGGHVLVESEPEQGTTFQILLPLVEGMPDEVNEQVKLPIPAVGGVVLVVEDDEAVLVITRRILSRAGYTVLEATNGRQALELTREYDGTIDVVISDVVMPEIGGVELLKQLREIAPDLKVVFVSGYSENEVRGEIRQMGSAFLAKPFTPEELLACIAAALS